MRAEGAMNSIRVRIRAAEFSATMTDISEWLDANGYQPIRYRYDHHEDAVLVTVDFPAKAAAEAFATRFDGAWPDNPEPFGSVERRSAPAIKLRPNRRELLPRRRGDGDAD